MTRAIIAFLWAVFVLLSSGIGYSTATEKPDVVVTIRPLHSIVAAVMKGTGAQPQLLMQQGGSPHDAALRPSQRRLLENARLVIWFGPELETAMTKTIEQLPATTKKLAVNRIDGLNILAPREPSYEANHEEHDHGTVDPHTWLDPENTIVIAAHVARVLGESDPEHAAQYKTNATAFTQQVKELSTDISAALKPVAAKAFLTLHDGLQYFEKRYGLNGRGSIMIDPGRKPGAKHIRALQKLIADENVRCLLTEPQYPGRFAALFAEKSPLKSLQIDIIGTDLPSGPDHYLSMMQSLKDQIRKCLTD